MAAASTQLTPGSRLGEYRILEHLARGGMADIYVGRRADAPEATPAVAIKRLRTSYDNKPEYVQMLADEARLMAQLEHPNIVRVEDISCVSNEFFFTMELVRGETLLRTLVKALRRKGELPLDQAVAIVLQAAEGLDYAHRARSASGSPLGVVHRDVSPANVLVGYDGTVKIADFGVARARIQAARTGEHIIKGKMGYMSPEQALCKPIDHRSDVFALGILLYEVTTGKKLFKGDSDYEVLTKVVRGCIPLPSSTRSHYPANLEAVVMCALEREPARRYATVRAFIAALSRVARDLRLATDLDTLAGFMRELYADVDDSAASADDRAAEEEAADTEVMTQPPCFIVSRRLPRRVRGADVALGTPPPVPNDESQSLDARFDDLDCAGRLAAQSPLAAEAASLMAEANRQPAGRTAARSSWMYAFTVGVRGGRFTPCAQTSGVHFSQAVVDPCVPTAEDQRL